MSNREVSILGCGWLGKTLGRVLTESGYRVRGSTTKKENVGLLEALGITPCVFQVSDLVDEELDEKFFDTDVLVISLPHGVKKGKAEEYVDQIACVMHAVKREKTKHVMLISTTSVYPNVNGVVTEDDADPENPIVKAEGIVMKSGIPSTVLRLAGLYGAGREPGRFLSGKRDVSGATSPVNLIHLDDCVAIIKSIIESNSWNEIFNACADEHPTRKEFYTNAALVIGLDPPVFSGDSKTEFKVVSNEHLKARLKYRFIHHLN